MSYSQQVDSFWSWVYLREEARLRGRTSDPTISNYHFANAIREYDKGTQWIRKWRTTQDLTPITAIWSYVIYRQLNYVPTFERRGIPSMTHDAATTWWNNLDQDRKLGMRLCTLRHWTGFSRLELGLHRIIEKLPQLEDELLSSMTGRDFGRQLTKLFAVGPFFSVQVTGDFLGDRHCHLAPDTIMPLAVGSRMGIHLLCTGEFSDNSASTGSVRHIIDVRPFEDEVLTALHADSRRLSIMTYTDIEHSLCEWYKWRAVQAGWPVKLHRRA